VLTISPHQRRRHVPVHRPARREGVGGERRAACPDRRCQLAARIHAIVPPLLAQFWPQILVSQHGTDTHGWIRGPKLSIDGQRAAHAAIHALTHD
jgi:acetoin utilization protein AcuC